MVNRLPSWLFITLALIIMGFALMPIIRALLGIDNTIQIEFLSAVMLLIAGLMCGLTGMLLLTRRQPEIRYADIAITSVDGANNNGNTNGKAVLIHASGLLIFTGIPLANFLACYFLWVKYRSTSSVLDTHGREAICQQITVYLYLLMCLFMALLIVGVFAVMILLCIHLIFTIIAIVQARNGSVFRYPANINIIDRKIVAPDRE